MSVELKPCPFCGNAALKIKIPKGIYPLLPKDLQLLDSSETFPDRGWISYFINCPDCGTCGPEANTPEEAVAKWNRSARVKDNGI